MIRKYVLIFVLLCGTSTFSIGNNGDDYIETIFDIFTNDVFDLNETDAEKVYFFKGVWMCGRCERVGELSLLHNETEFLNTKQPIELQINVAVEGSKCVTLSGRKRSRTLYGSAEVSGVCSDDVTYFFVRQRRGGTLDLFVKVYG